MKSLAGIAVGVGLVMGGSYAGGLRCNLTPSMPMGVWRVQSSQGPVRRGDIVTLCPEPAAASLGRNRGYLAGGECPGDVELLIKTVVAVPGDQVAVSPGGIAVNRAAVPESTPLPRDDRGRAIHPVDQGCYRVGPSEVWVIGGSDPRSYDSRYFGPVPIANLRGHAWPLFVTNESAARKVASDYGSMNIGVKP